MRVAVVGSRSITDYAIVIAAIKESKFKPTAILSGGARGVDALAKRYAKEHGIKYEEFLPDWSLGRKAGPIRNVEMLHTAEALVAVWDNKSRGTLNSISLATLKGMPLYVKGV